MPIVIFDLATEEFQSIGWLPPSEIDAFVDIIKKYGISTDMDDYKFFGTMQVAYWDGELQFCIEASHALLDD